MIMLFSTPALVSLVVLLAEKITQPTSAQHDEHVVGDDRDRVSIHPYSYGSSARRSSGIKSSSSVGSRSVRLPRSADPSVLLAPVLELEAAARTHDVVEEPVQESLLVPLLRALSRGPAVAAAASRKRRDIRDQLWGPRSKNNRGKSTRKSAPSRHNHHTDGLGELRDDVMVQGRDREQLRRRLKVQDNDKRVAQVHG